MSKKPFEYDLEIDTVFQVSTCHMTPKDNEILKANTDVGPAVHPQIIMEYEHGFMVSSFHNFKDNPENLEQTLLKLGHSPSYINLLRVAHEAGAKWMNLDCDAADYDFLPNHEW